MPFGLKADDEQYPVNTLIDKAAFTADRYREKLDSLVDEMNKECLSHMERQRCEYTIRVVLTDYPMYETGTPRKGMKTVHGTLRRRT